MFSDLPDAGNWAHAGIDFVTARGLMNGMGNGRFEPETTMSRAMVVTVLWRYEGQPQETGADFWDVDSGVWYAGAVAWASKHGIVNGMGDGAFAPDDNVTRAQMATILFRYVQWKGADSGNRASLSGFPDHTQVGSWATEALQWAVAQGIIGGTTETANGPVVLSPNGSATRAQVATILMRLFTGSRA